MSTLRNDARHDAPRRLLALSWAMPPLLFPRSIQVSRLLKELARRGWGIDVLCAHPGSPGLESVPRDATLEAVCAGGYRVLPVRWEGAPEQWEHHWTEAAVESANALLSAGALRSAGALQPAGGYAALVTFAQPWSDHEIGRQIKKRFGLPWVAHFSDPWSDSPYYSQLSAEVLRGYAAAEAGVVEAADAVVFTSQPTLDLVMAKYPADWRGKAFVVPHAYDADVLGAVRPQPRPSASLRLVHVGTLYQDARTPEGLFEALALLRKHDARAQGLELVFVGHAPEAVRQAAARWRVEDLVTWVGVRPYAESLGWMASADVLLVIDKQDPVSVFFPSKLVEYLPWGKPVLGLTPREGVTAGIVRSLNWPCVAPDDIAGMARALAALLDGQGRELPPVPEQKLRAYDIRHATNLVEDIVRYAAGACVAGVDDAENHEPKVKR